MPRILADAGLSVALFNRNDPAHPGARDVFTAHEPPFYTCEPVIVEAYFRLGQDRRVLELVREGDLVCDFCLQRTAARVCELLRKYADQFMDLADARLVRMIGWERHSVIYTVDRTDFSVYRRFRADPVPCVFSPAEPAHGRHAPLARYPNVRRLSPKT